MVTEATGTRVQCQALDLSDGGARLRSTWHPYLGKRISVKFQLEGRPVQMQGVVVWATEAEGVKECGVMFTVAHPSCRERVHQFVAQRLAEADPFAPLWGVQMQGDSQGPPLHATESATAWDGPQVGEPIAWPTPDGGPIPQPRGPYGPADSGPVAMPYGTPRRPDTGPVAMPYGAPRHPDSGPVAMPYGAPRGADTGPVMPYYGVPRGPDTGPVTPYPGSEGPGMPYGPHRPDHAAVAPYGRPDSGPMPFAPYGGPAEEPPPMAPIRTEISGPLPAIPARDPAPEPFDPYAPPPLDEPLEVLDDALVAEPSLYAADPPTLLPSEYTLVPEPSHADAPTLVASEFPRVPERAATPSDDGPTRMRPSPPVDDELTRRRRTPTLVDDGPDTQVWTLEDDDEPGPTRVAPADPDAATRRTGPRAPEPTRTRAVASSDEATTRKHPKCERPSSAPRRRRGWLDRLTRA